MDLLEQYEEKKLKHIGIEVIRENGDIEFQKKISLHNRDLLIVEVPAEWPMDLTSEIAEIFSRALTDDKMQALIVPEGLNFKVISVREE